MRIRTVLDGNAFYDIDEIISVLKKHKCSATFFVLGTWAEKYPEAIKALSDSGHEIANHSYNHTYYTTLTHDDMLLDIEKANELFALDLPESDEYQTIGGLILHQYQSFPKAHEIITLDKFQFRIIKVTATKIELVKLKVTE